MPQTENISGSRTYVEIDNEMTVDMAQEGGGNSVDVEYEHEKQEKGKEEVQMIGEGERAEYR
jgi:hypothetical protein